MIPIAMNSQYSLLLAFPLLFTIGVLALLYDGGNDQKTDNQNTINAIIGDESYIQIFGKTPGDHVPDHIRIQTHLEYVKSILKERPADHLTAEQQKNRAELLNHLRDYILAGDYPHNDGHPDPRRPTFISNNSHICAVGYLVEQSAGREVAKQINELFKYAYINQIDDPVFEEWAESSGFTIEELAMIQPAYGPVVVEEAERNKNRISAPYAVSSTVLAGANALYLSNRSEHPWMFNNASSNHWFGLAAGAGAFLFGVMNTGETNTYYESLHPNSAVDPNTGLCMMGCPVREINETNHAKNIVSMSNIGIGLFSMVRAGYHLMNGTETEEQGSGFGVTQLQAEPFKNNEAIPALSYSVRF